MAALAGCSVNGGAVSHLLTSRRRRFSRFPSQPRQHVLDMTRPEARVAPVIPCYLVPATTCTTRAIQQEGRTGIRTTIVVCELLSYWYIDDGCKVALIEAQIRVA